MFCMCRALTLPSPCVTLAFLALGVPAGATAPIAFGRGDARACLADLCCCAVGALDAMISHPMRVPGGHGGWRFPGGGPAPGAASAREGAAGGGKIITHAPGQGGAGGGGARGWGARPPGVCGGGGGGGVRGGRGGWAGHGEFVRCFTEVLGGGPVACIGWQAAAGDLGGAGLACSASEAGVLRIAASLGGGAPVSLRAVLGGLDHVNIALVASAVRHANGATSATVTVPAPPRFPPGRSVPAAGATVRRGQRPAGPPA